MATFNLFVVNFQVKSPTTPPRPITIPNAVLDDHGNRTKPSILTWDGNPNGGQAAAGKQDIYGQYPGADAYRRGVRTALTAPASAHPKDIAAVLANHVTTLLDTSQPTGWDVFGNPVSFGGEAYDILNAQPIVQGTEGPIVWS